MCSRFELSATPRDLARRFALSTPPPVPNAAELRPTNQALVIVNENGFGPEGRLLGWGLGAEWTAKPLINARAETLAEKRTFRRLLQNRCLVPATAYFEWRKDDGARLKNRIRSAGDLPFAFAGITDGERFTIATCAPVPGIAHIHDRMPVILDPAAEPLWIDPAVRFNDVRKLLVPFTAKALVAVEETPKAGSTVEPDLFS